MEEPSPGKHRGRWGCHGIIGLVILPHLRIWSLDVQGHHCPLHGLKAFNKAQADQVDREVSAEVWIQI